MTDLARDARAGEPSELDLDAALENPNPVRAVPSIPPPSRWLVAAWPAFVMAGVLEALVFVVVDPEHMAWFGETPLALSRQAVYTVTFFIFWSVIAAACGITAFLVAADRRRGAPQAG